MSTTAQRGLLVLGVAVAGLAWNAAALAPTSTGLPNVPPWQTWLPLLRLRLALLRAGLPEGTTVSSGYRSALVNESVGGVVRSAHLLGEAADLVPPPGVSMRALAAHVRESGVFSYVLSEGDHVHVEI